MLHDLKTALRQLARDSGFAAVVVAILSAAVCANVVAFTFINCVLLRPLPYHEPERLVRIWENNPQRGILGAPVSPATYLDWRRDAKSFEAMEAFDPPRDMLVQFGADAELVRVSGVTEGFMAMLGAAPLADTGERGYRMGAAFLQRRFGGDANSALHQRVIVEGFRDFPVAITGIVPQQLDFTTGSDLWAPLSFGQSRAVRSVNVLARLRRGVSLENARAEMDIVSRRLARAFPAENDGWRAEVVPFQQTLVGDVRPTLLVLWFSVSLFLLTATANVAVLFVARRLQREKDIAICFALGATRWRLLRQRFVYAAALSTISTAIGLGVAAFVVYWLRSTMPIAVPRLSEVSISRAVIGITVLIAVSVAAIIVALGSAPRPTSVDVLRTAQVEGRSGSTHLRTLMLIAEVSAATCLLALAMQSVGAFVYLLRTPLGFDPRDVLSIDVRQPINKPGETVKHYPTRRFLRTQEALVDYVARLPGVSAAAVVSHPPLTRPLTRAAYRLLEGSLSGPLTGAPPVSGADTWQAAFETVDAGFFDALRVPLIEGRIFTAADRLDQREVDDFDADRGSGVAIVSAAFAQRHWPHASAIGRFVAVDRASYRSLEIVGVAGDVTTTPGVSPVPTIYVPYAQNPMDRFTLLVRAENQRPLRSTIMAYMRRQFGDDVIAYNVQTYDAVASAALARPRVSARVMSVFAAAAMGLTALALYSVLSFVVTRRRRELAIRLALGADPRRLIASVVRGGLGTAAIGVTAGLAAAVAAGHVFRSALVEFEPVGATDAGVAAALVLAAASAAMYRPAKSIEALDPLPLLKAE